MPHQIWAIQSLNENSRRNYPLAEEATALDEAEEFRLPTDFLLALVLTIPAGFDIRPTRVFLRAVTVTGAGYRLDFAYDDASDAPPRVASVNIPASTHQEYDEYLLLGLDDFAEATGQVVIGRLENINGQPAGRRLFSSAAGQLDPTVVRPMLAGVTSLQVRNGVELSPPISGFVRFQNGTNTSLSVSELDGLTTIRWDAIQGAGLNDSCECDDDPDEGVPIRFISDVGPGPDGNVDLIAGNCVEITAVTNGLLIRDSCDTACCGCPELEALTSRMMLVESNIPRLQTQADRLESITTQTADVILASRLGDAGCTVE